MASFRAVRRALCTAAEASPAPAATPSPSPAPGGRWERLKQSKAGVWIRSMFSDYKEACREVAVGARERPLKATVYVSLLGGAYACFYTKPDQSSFYAALLDRSNQLALLSPWIRNAASDRHVQSLMQQWNQGRLRHLGLGLCSLIYSTDFDPQSALYEASCSNLAVRWRDLPHRVLDVGFAGRWWLLERSMEDFDVNEDEFKHLPSHMQATSPPSVQEVERSEQLHKDSWLPIAVQEEEEEEEVQVQASSQQDLLSPEPADTQRTVTVETPQEPNRETTTEEETVETPQEPNRETPTEEETVETPQEPNRETTTEEETVETPQEPNRETTTEEETVETEARDATGWTLNVQEETRENIHVEGETGEDLQIQGEAGEDLQIQGEAGEDLQVQGEAGEDLQVQGEAGEDLQVQGEAGEDFHVEEMQNDTVVVETVDTKEKEEEGVEQIEAQSLRN
ncbi:unnamed protein product [Knipowitschia caucasica]|uniref:Uncharacterized protein n=1 Tax=Knipowitschia caucasica TaxID=637954 RepID=A0AAV2KH39_KNICA